MRRIFIASALVSPLLLSAAAFAVPPVTDDVTNATSRALSTGVKPAHVIYSTNINFPADAVIPTDAEFVLHMNVDPAGSPQDVEVVKSPNSGLDAPVAAAVRKFRFSPATLDKQPVAAEMTLTVFVQH
ncbi:MAG: TonB family protein [Terracidiphilus sp.]|jgi:TonB family protein